MPLFCEGISQRYKLLDLAIVSIKDDLLKEPVDMILIASHLKQIDRVKVRRKVE